MTLQIDPGVVVAVCAAFGAIGGAVGWAARHFIRDVVDVKPKTELVPADHHIEQQLAGLGATLATLSEALGSRLTVADLMAALAKHELSMIDRFNGRYPSKEVFVQALDALKDDLAELRKYIGDVRRDLVDRLTREGNRLDERMAHVERLLRSREHDEN